MALPQVGHSAKDVLDTLGAMAERDIDWQSGRAFSLTYLAGDDVAAIANQAHQLYASTNALNTDAFPSLRVMQADVVAIVSGWLSAGADAAGFMTSGGTESILLAVKASVQRGRRERQVRQPNVVLPMSAHAAFEKACSYFGAESRRVAVRPDFRADVDAMAAAVDDDTVLVVGSAPQFPQGVIDDIPALAAIAAGHGVSCHVDACMGGVTLPYLAPLSPWNFAVPGVTSMSVDLHKYGYTAKGASVIVYRDKTLRADQTFVTDNWLGGVYGSSGILGTKGGGPIAAAWAVLHYLGDDGYRRLAATARAACVRLADAIEAIDGLRLLATPDATLLAFTSADGDAAVDRISAELRRRGWYLDRQGPPSSLHCTVNAVHDRVLDQFVADLREAAATGTTTTTSRATGQETYGTIE